MKRKIFSLIICGILLVCITGCDNNSANDSNKKDSGVNNQEKKEDSKSDVVKKNYNCSLASDDGVLYYLYYENDELVKLTFESIYADNDDYKEAQEDVKDCKATTVSRKNGKLYIDFDVKNGAMSCLVKESVFVDESDTSIKNINGQMHKKGFSCSLVE